MALRMIVRLPPGNDQSPLQGLPLLLYRLVESNFQPLLQLPEGRFQHKPLWGPHHG